MSAKFFYLLEELKDDSSPKILAEVMSILDNELIIDDIFVDYTKAKNAFNGQDESFYNELSIRFLSDLNETPEMYFMVWEPIIELLNTNEKSIFLHRSLENYLEGDSDDYINGMQSLESGSPDVALFYFNRIDHYVASYFVGICYLELQNDENAIIEFNLFLKYLNDTLKLPNLENENGLTIAKWNTHNDLGYLYNQIEDYQKAKENYKAGLEIFNLEENYKINNQQGSSDDYDEFTIWTNNYLLALEKTNSINEAIELLKFAIQRKPSNIYFKKKLNTINDQEKNNVFADNLFKRLFPPKQPFGISRYTLNKFLSKEKVLEDLIVEQIKYGFYVFGRPLEIYKDDMIYGRQYPISSVNGILDLLLIDKSNDQLYIVELKRNEAGIEVVEQIEKYIKGLSEELNRKIKGIICLHKPDNALTELVKTKENIELYTYEFEFRKLQ